MARRAIATERAPKAIGPYSQGLEVKGIVFVSGQVGIEPATGKLADGIEAQTEQAIRNVRSVLEAAGLGMDAIAKTTLWLTAVEHFATVNEIYARHRPSPAPARSAPIVAALPRGALISIEAIAVRP
jgi:2-iminobutanoate/2-iminopropanoate deaminase